VTTFTVTINGRGYGPTEVRDELTMNDYLREYLGLTGTKFGCGATQCLSCAVIVDNPDGSSYTSPTCIVPAVRFNGKTIRTVEGHAKNGELTILQKAFIEHFDFQCGGLSQRSSGSARTPSEETRATCRSREDHRRGARWPPLPLHRLCQVS
jgi:aerobic-type carbon monoxide dehydrogenase small subunit (CoxS/CutS family)